MAQEQSLLVAETNSVSQVPMYSLAVTASILRQPSVAVKAGTAFTQEQLPQHLELQLQ
jgi:hypothetical protein